MIKITSISEKCKNYQRLEPFCDTVILRNCHVNPTAKLEFRGWSCPTLTTRDLRRYGQPECQSAPLPLCNQRACPPDHRSPQSVPRGRTPSHGSTSRHRLSGSGTLAQEGGP